MDAGGEKKTDEALLDEIPRNNELILFCCLIWYRIIGKTGTGLTKDSPFLVNLPLVHDFLTAILALSSHSGQTDDVTDG